MSDDIRIDDYVDDLLAEPASVPVAPAVAPAHTALAPTPAATKSDTTVVDIPKHLRAVLDVPPPPPAATVSRPKRWLCFDVAGQSFAVELMKVQEVQRVPTIVPVRGAPPDLLGVINLRGEIVHVLDLGMHLGFPACDASTPAARVIVLEEKGKTVGMLVSTVADVATLSDSDIERAETSLRAFPCAAMRGVARHGKTLVALLDASELMK